MAIFYAPLLSDPQQPLRQSISFWGVHAAVCLEVSVQKLFLVDYFLLFLKYSIHWILCPVMKLVTGAKSIISCSSLFYLLRRLPISASNTAPQIFRHTLFSNGLGFLSIAVFLVQASRPYVRVVLTIVTYNLIFDLLDSNSELRNFVRA